MRADQPWIVSARGVSTALMKLAADPLPHRDQADFRRLWIGQTTSELGSGVTALVLPLAAVATLHAGTFAVGLLQAGATIGLLATALPAGRLTDRGDPLRIMIRCDIGRLIAIGSIPTAAAIGLLSMPQLCIVAIAVGMLSTVFGIAYHSLYPSLVDADQRAWANARIGTTEALARVCGPGLGAGIMAALGGMCALIFDTVTYLISLRFLLRIRTAPKAPPPNADQNDWRIFRLEPALTRTILCTVTAMFSLGISSAVMIVFLIRDMSVPPALVGIILGGAEIGGLLAAFAAPPLIIHIGPIRTMRLVGWLSPFTALPLVAGPGNAILLSTTAMSMSAARFVLFDIAQYTYRQRICPPGFLGRLNATARTGIGVASTLGALAGGGIAEIVGIRWMLGFGAVVLCAANVFLFDLEEDRSCSSS